MMNQKLEQIVKWGYWPKVMPDQPYPDGEIGWVAFVGPKRTKHLEALPWTESFFGDSPEIVVEDMYMYVKDKAMPPLGHHISDEGKKGRLSKAGLQRFKDYEKK